MSQISESQSCAKWNAIGYSLPFKDLQMHSKKMTQGQQTPSALQAAQLTECIRKEER